MGLRVLHHREEFQSGIVVLQSEPQMRTISVDEGHDTVKRTFPFPYLIFTIRYTISRTNGKYIYHGNDGLGLYVYCRKEPMKSFDSVVLYIPTDYDTCGYVCTDHDYDDSEYDSVKELVEEVVGLWWSMIHEIHYHPGRMWGEIQFDKLDEADWRSAGKFFDMINSCSGFIKAGNEMVSLPLSALGDKK